MRALIPISVVLREKISASAFSQLCAQKGGSRALSTQTLVPLPSTDGRYTLSILARLVQLFQHDALQSYNWLGSLRARNICKGNA